MPTYLLPTGIPRPPLGGSSSSSSSSEGGTSVYSPEEQWERMAMLLAVCTAGMVRYLLSCFEDPEGGYDTDA
jgi:hypothetical protein